MKVLIVSDTHRKDTNLQEVIARTKPFDMLIHLGDAEGSEDRIRRWCLDQNPACEIHIVQGNNDFFSALPREEEVMIGRYRALLTHGHYYGVSVGPERLLEEAEYRGVQMAMFGHTHKPMLAEENGIVLLNPGSLSYPRQEGRRPSYMQIEIDREGEAHYTISYLEK
ncbi:MAG: metallophosphoesterase [Clostridium sp.]|nr:metallophosphoesterase [Clostridium sp.]